MFNVCPHCGLHEVEKTIDPSGPFAICSSCHYAQPFLQLPLFMITGASGSGKSTVCIELAGRMRKECVILETDIIWDITPSLGDTYSNLWLRLAKNIGQAGLPVVLCGTALPDHFESCPERRYFSALHYLSLVCDDNILRARLSSRPAWRNSYTEAFLQHMSDFNLWLKEHAATTTPPMTLYDTSATPLDQTVNDVIQWIHERL
jgi:hypothetical protein